MAMSEQHAYPSPDEIVEGVRQHGNFVAYARSLGISSSTLRNHTRKVDGLQDRIREVTKGPALRSALPVLGETVSREELLTQENAELRRALSGARRGEVTSERMLVALERALETVSPPTPLRIKPQGPFPSGDAHHRALLLVSDAHGGEVVDAGAVNHINAYDWEIMRERHRELVHGTLSHMRCMPPLTGLDIGILGDNNSGANHRELEVTNQVPLAQQGVRMGFLLADDLIANLAPAVPEVRVFSVPGNHPRLTDKPAAKNVLNNMDYVSTIVAEERCRDLANVSWTQPEGGAMFWMIAGRLCYVWHGDGVRSSMPGVPWGGVMRRTNEIQRQHASRIDHFILGHFHQANVVQGGRIIMNGSVKGVDEWVLKQFGGGDPPTQLLVVFDERRHRMTDVRYLTPTAGIPNGIAA